MKDDSNTLEALMRRAMTLLRAYEQDARSVGRSTRARTCAAIVEELAEALAPRSARLMPDLGNVAPNRGA